MDTVTLTLSSLVMIALVIMIAPNILRRNKGVALRNIAIWVGIFCLLALAYRYVGPGKQLVLNLDSPASLSDSLGPDATEVDVPQPTVDLDQDQGFLPPRE